MRCCCPSGDTSNSTIVTRTGTRRPRWRKSAVRSSRCASSTARVRPKCVRSPRVAAVRQEMIATGWCRTLINRRIDRVKRAFRWATSREERDHVAVYTALRTLPGLQRGRTEARESEPVKPVDPAHVATVLPYLSRHARAMVELQMCTGTRPGEICASAFSKWTRPRRTVRRLTDQSLGRRHRRCSRYVSSMPSRAVAGVLHGDKPPPSGFEHIELNDPKQSDARLVAADAYQEAGRDRDAELLRDLSQRVAFVEGCVIDPAAPVFSPKWERAERLKRWRAARKSKVPHHNRTVGRPIRSARRLHDTIRTRWRTRSRRGAGRPVSSGGTRTSSGTCTRPKSPAFRCGRCPGRGRARTPRRPRSTPSGSRTSLPGSRTR